MHEIIDNWAKLTFFAYFRYHENGETGENIVRDQETTELKQEFKFDMII